MSEIIAAVMQGHLDQVKALLDKKHDLNQIDRMKRTALMMACIRSSAEMVALLLENGADPNFHDQMGKGALHFAASREGADFIKILVRGGAVVDAQDSNGNTPLFDAVFNFRGDDMAIRALLTAGADFNLKNAHGVSPKDLSNTISNYDSKYLFNG